MRNLTQQAIHYRRLAACYFYQGDLGMAKECFMVYKTILKELSAQSFYTPGEVAR